MTILLVLSSVTVKTACDDSRDILTVRFCGDGHSLICFS